MSDISTGGAAPETPAAPAPAPEGQAPPAPATDDLSPFGEHAPYVKSLREEAAKWRTSYKPFEDAFGGYVDEDRAAWLELARLTSSDPAKAAAEFQRIGSELGQRYPGEPDPAQAPAGDQPAPLTQADLERILGEREQKAELERQVKSVTDAVAVKYEAGTPEYREALWHAANSTNGDVDAALAKVAEREQAIVDRYLTGKEGQARKFGSPVTPSGQQAGEGTGIKTFADAKASMLARIAASKQQ